ncbi:hypothetical protein KIL84_020022, partial [Mauremys mutica]
PSSNIKKSQEVRRKEKQRHRSSCSENICTKVKLPRYLKPCEQVASWEPSLCAVPIPSALLLSHCFLGYIYITIPTSSLVRRKESWACLSQWDLTNPP